MKSILKFLINIIYVIKQNIFKHNKLSMHSKYRNNIIDDNVRIQENCIVNNSSIGNYSYIGRNSYISNVSIGKFCSISVGFMCAFGRHPTHQFVSTHPYFYSKKWNKKLKENKFEEFRYINKEKNIFATIGNDVWIGANVTILDGIKIGDGAIIGAASVVTKDIPDYAIAVGNPAKVIGYRFEKEDIEFLQKLKWWDKDSDWVNNNSLLFKDIKLIKENTNE